MTPANAVKGSAAAKGTDAVVGTDAVLGHGNGDGTGRDAGQGVAGDGNDAGGDGAGGDGAVDDAAGTGPGPHYERLMRRETHSSRTTASILAAVVVVALSLWGLFETALKSIGQLPWLASPEQAAGWLGGLPEDSSRGLLCAAGAGFVLIGLYFFLSAVLPGRRARHAIPNERAVVVVDDRVLAASLARRARLQARVSTEQVVVIVSRRLVEVQLRPTSGLPVDESAVRAAIEDELRRNSVSPVPPVRIRLAPVGVIGV